MYHGKSKKCRYYDLDMKREDVYAGKIVKEMEEDGGRGRGRPKRRWIIG